MAIVVTTATALSVATTRNINQGDGSYTAVNFLMGAKIITIEV